MKKLILTLFLFLIANVYSQAQVKVSVVNGITFYGTIEKSDIDSLILMDFNRSREYIAKKNIISIEEIKCKVKNKKGNIFVGRIETIDDNTIKLKCNDGTIKEFETPKVEVTYAGFNFNRSNKTGRLDSTYKDLYYFGGLTLNNPGDYNINFGSYVIPKMAISCSIGYLRNLGMGVQINMMLNLLKNSTMDINMGICTGFKKVDGVEIGFDPKTNQYIKTNPYYFSYTGGVLDLNWHGLFLEPCFYFVQYAKAKLFVQFGYVYRLNNK